MIVEPVVSSRVEPPPLASVNLGLPMPFGRCPADLYDGWVLHEAALRNGLNTLLFPGQALMAFPGEDPTGGVAFAHGVANSTWISAATMVQDKRIRRDVLDAAGIPQPRGRAFSLQRGRTYAKEFAETIGYPVVVKPMVGDSTVEVMPRLRNADDLDQAIDYLWKVPPSRANFTQASYAFTQILSPKTSSSTRTRGTYRYLVEEHVAGQYLRLLLADGRLLSAVHAPGGPWNLGEGVRDVTGEIHADIEAFAQGAAEATPGMPVLTVDIVVNDFTGPTAHENRPVLVEHSERPWMYLQHVADERRISELGHELLQSSARHAGLTLPGSGMGTQERVTFRWEGLSQVAEDIQAAEAAAGQMQLDLRFTSTDPVAGVVCGEVSGPPAVIALLSEFVIDGHVLTAPAMAVETRPA